MSRFVAPLPPSKHAERAHQPAIASSPPVLPPVLPVLPPRPPNTHQSSGSLNARPTPMLPPRPPPTPPTPETHSLHKPSESLQLDPLPVPQIVVDLDSGSPVLTPDEPVEYEEEKELSEQQLREMYDEEELDRFLHLFSAVSAVFLLCISARLTIDVVRERSASTRRASSHLATSWQWPPVDPFSYGRAARDGNKGCAGRRRVDSSSCIRRTNARLGPSHSWFTERANCNGKYCLCVRFLY
jgi:hypothetical protein